MHISALKAGTIHLLVDLIIQGEASPLLLALVLPKALFFIFRARLHIRPGDQRGGASYPPATQEHIRTLMPCEVLQSVEESCIKGGRSTREERMDTNTLIGNASYRRRHPVHQGDIRIRGRGKVWLDDGYPGSILSESARMDRTRQELGAFTFASTSLPSFQHVKKFRIRGGMSRRACVSESRPSRASTSPTHPRTSAHAPRSGRPAGEVRMTEGIVTGVVVVSGK
ncbi:hypothetical protein C8R45DRAFT_945168 [Mycena sanguinolenta]|nr:hypothetical protein C8R45DRAFT_945168 [Mycena sanguinolenta]